MPENNKQNGELLTIKDVARILNIHTSTANHWHQKGLIKCVRLGRSVRFAKEEIERVKREGIKTKK